MQTFRLVILLLLCGPSKAIALSTTTTSQTKQQLELINQMKGASKPLDLTKVEYIDLSNPESPSVKLKP